MLLRHVSIELNLKEEELEGNHLVISCTINKNSANNIPIYTLIDCSAMGYIFVDDEFARYHSLLRYCLKTERELEVIDGRPIKFKNIIHITKISLFINGYKKRLLVFITHLGYYSLVLGKLWLKRHDICIQFATDMVILDLPYCLNNCIEHVVQIKGITINPPECISATPPPSPFLPILPAPPMSTSAVSPLPASAPLPTSPSQPALPPSITMILAAAFWRSIRRRSAYICTLKMTIAEIDQAITCLDRAVVDEGVEEEVQIKALVPGEYHEFLLLTMHIMYATYVL